MGTLSVTDPDAGDSHSFTVSDARFEVVSGALKLKAGQSLDHETEPTVSLTVTATDSGTLSVSQPFTITVTAANNPPVAMDDAYSVNEDTMLSVAAPGVLGNDSDADGDPLTAVPASGPTNGALTLNNASGSFTYVPNADFTGPDTFTYKVNDGTADSNEATVTITVLPVSGGTGSVTGTVTDTSGKGINRADVQTDTGQSTKTTKKGKYTLTDVPAGGVTVTASKSGYVSQQQAVTVTDGNSTTVDFALAEETGGGGTGTGSVKGTVKDSGGSRVEGALVKVETPEPSTTTNKGGKYNLGGVPAGSHTLTASKNGCAQDIPVIVVDGNTLRVDVALSCLP